MSKTRPLMVAALAATLASSLTACFPVIVAGTAAGTLAAADRRTFGAQTEDKAIAVKAEVKVPNVAGNAGHVNINAFNRKVLLTGEVRDEEMKAAVEREVKGIEGVVSVVNELEVAGLSSYSSRSNDALITSKVKLSLADAKDISANSFKVVTEKGAVFLMGRVTQREGTQAADIARGVAGVTKVVKVFEYISEDDVKQYQPSQQASQG